jgi:GDP-L-fucose synthase
MQLNDKRVLVTGGGGFLGQWVVNALRQRGCREISVPRQSKYDLRHEEAILRLFNEAKPEVILHLAASVGGIGANRLHPGKFFYDNAVMGIQLMEQARLHGVEKFVNIGTICMYPKVTPVPFKERDIWNGYPEETNAPYGLAKKMMMVQGQAYRDEYGFNAITLLPTNLYGPGEHFDLELSHVIPAVIRKCVEAKERGESEIVLWGDGSVSREFLYVEDAVEGILLATEKYNGREPVNLGVNQETTIRDLVHIVVDEVGFKGNVVWDTTKPNGQPRRCLDTSLAESAFGFRPKWSLREGLRVTIQWYLRNREEAFVSEKPAPEARDLGLQS